MLLCQPPTPDERRRRGEEERRSQARLRPGAFAQAGEAEDAGA